ncbi:hypothetical protein ACFO25_00345 [Paenactinomyces guangxiensis]|uniref:Uncharacterized protein n=1 Tax=Paenactinomyces guangxiensis TaxID=1490290 RepID=A0A7W1WSI6_9BACL|nr:hypothetical protein [Paenactinomyces guangxiensis]MBA4495231.1 hypothetical protein [Paenactinomyces guangxiensis]MBH8592315.1 hypothetical protein [Paenactinomyces guangxiensis]
MYQFLVWKKSLIVVSIFSLVALTGCNQLLDQIQKEAGKNEADAKSSNEGSDVEGAQAANQTYKEIPFTPINWVMGAPDRQPQGGVWIYTKEEHPGSLDNSSHDWEKKDMLLVQIKEKKYYGYKMEITALQVIKPDVIRIVVKLNKGTTSSSTEGEAARRYAELDKGAIDPKKMKFIVETETGERLNQN